MPTPEPAPGPVALPFVHDNIRAILWILLSVVTSSAMAVAVRQSTLEIDSRMVGFLRFGIGAVAMTAYFLAWQRPRGQRLRLSRPGLHLVRGILMAVSTHMGFYAIAHLELVTSTVLFFCAPIFATLFAGFLHGEVPGARRLSAVAVGFLGVLIVLRPGFGSFDPVMLIALGSSLLFAMALVLSRPLAQADGAFSSIFSTTILTALISLPLAWPVWEMPQDTVTWLAMGALIATGFIRTGADLQAYRFGEAATLAPLTYLRVVLIGGAAYAIWGEVPDGAALAGATVIVAAAVYIARREAMLRRRGSTGA